MSRIYVTACWVALIASTPGCQQTTGSSANSPLTPVGPLSPVGLAPVNSGSSAAPSFNPFTAPTRVPPPPNNAFNPQAGNPGGYVPYGPNATMGASFQQPNPTRYTATASTAPSIPGNEPIPGNDYWQPVGSGVATTSWAETNAGIQRTSNHVDTSSVIGSSSQPINTQPRLSGMHVNDLTGGAAQSTYVAPQISSVVPPASFSQGYYPPTVDPLSRQPSGSPTLAVPSTDPAFQGSERFAAPSPTAPSSLTESTSVNLNDVHRDASGTAESNDLRWRRPTTRF